MATTYNKPNITVSVNTMEGFASIGDEATYTALKAHKTAEARTEEDDKKTLIPFHAVQYYGKAVISEEVTKADAYGCDGGGGGATIPVTFINYHDNEDEGNASANWNASDLEIGKTYRIEGNMFVSQNGECTLQTVSAELTGSANPAIATVGQVSIVLSASNGMIAFGTTSPCNYGSVDQSRLACTVTEI